MKPFESNVSSKYGAPMGRHSNPNDLFGLIRLCRVPLYDGCYDKGGAYWGGPSNLWCAYNKEGTFYFRADSRVDAKRQLTDLDQDISFYR